MVMEKIEFIMNMKLLIINLELIGLYFSKIALCSMMMKIYTITQKKIKKEKDKEKKKKKKEEKNRRVVIA